MKLFVRRLVLSVPLALILGAGGCRSEQTKEDSGDARKLFQELKQATCQYTDSMKNLSDSVSTDALSERFEKRIADISFSYPPGTDSQLTEGENNELYKLMQDYVKARDKAYNSPAPVDSASTSRPDSLVNHD